MDNYLTSGTGPRQRQGLKAIGGDKKMRLGGIYNAALKTKTPTGADTNFQLT